jgi:hypothetical protein
MDRPCDHCDHPDSSLLRLVLIGEIIRADDDTLYAMAEVFEALGLLQLTDEDTPPTPSGPTKPGKHRLHRVK